MGAVKTGARRPGPREEGLGASCPYKPQLPACRAVPSPAPLVAPPGGRTSAAARRPGRWALPPPRPGPASRRRARAAAAAAAAGARPCRGAWCACPRGRDSRGRARAAGPRPGLLRVVRCVRVAEGRSPVHARRPRRWKRTAERPHGLASSPGRVSHQAPPFRLGPERGAEPLRGWPESDAELKPPRRWGNPDSSRIGLLRNRKARSLRTGRSP